MVWKASLVAHFHTLSLLETLLLTAVIQQPFLSLESKLFIISLIHLYPTFLVNEDPKQLILFSIFYPLFYILSSQQGKVITLTMSDWPSPVGRIWGAGFVGACWWVGGKPHWTQFLKIKTSPSSPNHSPSLFHASLPPCLPQHLPDLSLPLLLHFLISYLASQLCFPTGCSAMCSRCCCSGCSWVI